ncbi:MAG TPA: IS481 family transposase [Polyangia bacterium]|nr:IS481 family transposase [Polyangia bacterium]
MQLARFLVEAVVLGKQSPNQLVRAHPISRSWFYELLGRYRRDGPAALEPKSHRPASCPHQVEQALVDAILELRAELSAAGLDAGPQTILHHLASRFDKTPSRVTIWRILKRQGLVTPQPHKRPRASFVRFEAQLPNELWQTDATEWHLADSGKVEILNLIDDHSRLCLASVAFRTVKAADAVQTFYSAVEEWGPPARFLSDNAAVFSGRSRRGRVALESELDRLGIQCVHSTPYHPQTCGKVERFHQTLKLFLAKQAAAQSLAHLQVQLDAFRTIYNRHRPHRALDGRTPLQAFNARLKASPSLAQPQVDYRVRRDRLDAGGRVTLRYLSRLRHFHVSYRHRGEPVIVLVAGEHVRVLTEDGSLLRELTLDPTRDYQRSTAPTLVRHQVRQRSAST